LNPEPVIHPYWWHLTTDLTREPSQTRPQKR
jgi:hypothetical protein